MPLSLATSPLSLLVHALYFSSHILFANPNESTILHYTYSLGSDKTFQGGYRYIVSLEHGLYAQVSFRRDEGRLALLEFGSSDLVVFGLFSFSSLLPSGKPQGP